LSRTSDFEIGKFNHAQIWTSAVGGLILDKAGASPNSLSPKIAEDGAAVFIMLHPRPFSLDGQ
jgi:hypothetical protein